MTWHYINSKKIAHCTGTSIKLLRGTWERPEGIDPRCYANLTAIESAKVVREGLAFAKLNPYEKSKPPSTVIDNQNKTFLTEPLRFRQQYVV